MSSGDKMLVFFGSYAPLTEPSLYVSTWNNETGELQLTDQISGIQNPTFLDIDPVQYRLYCVGEALVEESSRRGEALAFEINPLKGNLTLLNREVTLDSTTCHIILDRSRQALFTASYHGGTIGVSPVLSDGRIGALTQSLQQTGSSILPAQTQPRAHSATPSPDNRYVLTCDLGADKVVVYSWDQEQLRLEMVHEVHTAPGSGPRHLAFHPTEPLVYVIHELNATVTVYKYDTATGGLEELQVISTLPEGYEGEKSCADIHVAPDGRFVYGSNRGHDSIVVYEVDPSTGLLRVVEFIPSGGGHPRNFALSPDGRFLLTANRDGNNIVVFQRDTDTGKLQPTGHELTLSKPVCIKFMKL